MIQFYYNENKKDADAKMSTIICSIVNEKYDEYELAKQFIDDTIKSDSFLTENFNQILKNIRNYSIVSNDIINSDGSKAGLPIVIYLRSRLGIHQRAEIVKSLCGHQYAYEIRLDEQYKHHRIIFLLHDCEDSLFVMTFGFTKENNKPSTDVTNQCGACTNEIALEFIEGKTKFWLGDEIYDYKIV